MLKVQTEDLLRDLQNFRNKNLEGFRQMVTNFAYEVTSIAILKTPLGDADLYASLYQNREKNKNWQSYGLYPFEGFARGSWRVAVNGSREVQAIYGKNSGDYALREAQNSLKSYKLGDKVMISNYGPYIKNLERNSSKQTDGQGIIAPTIDSVMRIAAISLKNSYEKA